MNVCCVIQGKLGKILRGSGEEGKGWSERARKMDAGEGRGEETKGGWRREEMGEDREDRGSQQVKNQMKKRKVSTWLSPCAHYFMTFGLPT